MLGFGIPDSRLGFGVWGLGFRASGSQALPLGLVLSLGFGAEGLRFRIHRLGFKIDGFVWS